MLTNFQKWRNYCDGLISPDNYIDFGFYFLIAAALQRRVWIGPKHSPLYSNHYTILVGNPGIGKGLVIKQVYKVLTHHKLKNPAVHSVCDEKDPDKEFIKAVAEADYEKATKILNPAKDKNKDREQPLLIPVGADDTTYESFVETLANCIRRINYKHFDEKTQKHILVPYAHSSLAFCLEELSSLFKVKAEKVVNAFLKCYDCGDYNYDTKTQGKDRVKNICLSIFAGTTPSYMQEIITDRILDEGFSSRTFFIFASKNRKIQLRIPDLTPEQEECYKDILKHVERLSHLYGQVQVSDDVWKNLEAWWYKQHAIRVNNNIRLDGYYSRKQIHVEKIAMAIHFGESTEMTMEWPVFQRAIEILDQEEVNMHHALGMDTANPLAKVTAKVVRYLAKVGAATRKELLGEFWNSLPNKVEDMDEILEHLMAQDIAEMVEIAHPLTKKQTEAFKLKERPNV